ncbi:MAG: hypothetical protein COB85_05075 [Bacteroidetes bacterium]|nr:MAG: hypothetical protein COB85_05075 [Bacteroidota bacterium]
MLYAQEYADEEEEEICDPPDNSKAIKLFEKALKIIRKEPDEAYGFIKEALVLDPEYLDANYKMARLAMGRENYLAAKKYLLKVLDVCPEYNIYVHFYLGRIYYGSEEYSKAVKELKEFIKHPDDIKADRHYDAAEKIIKEATFYAKLYEHPVPFNPINVPGICTQKDEYLPFISADNTIAYFTRKFQRKSRDDMFAKTVEVFTFSKMGEKIFDEGKDMPAPFNRGSNEGGASLTINNMHMYFTICKSLMNGYNNCDIFTADYVYIDESSLLDMAFMKGALNMTDAELKFELAEIRKSGSAYMWTNVRSIGEVVNSMNSWESQPSISSDGQTLYFTSNRKGGIGGLDIYKSEKDTSGHWGKPINLGWNINTTGNEKSPFIHPDKKTLYFSSDGRKGVGGYDIYYSKYRQEKKDSTGKRVFKWQKPENIGFPINSEDDDLGFFTSTDGQTGYFSSNNSSKMFRSKGGWDLYTFPLYERARPEKVLFLKGSLKDENGEKIVGAKMDVVNVQTKEITQVEVDSVSGVYAAVVTIEDDQDEFIMTVTKENFAFNSQFIKAEDVNKNVTGQKPAKLMDVELIEVSLGEPYKLERITFATNSSSVLTMESMMVLDGFAKYLQDYPDMRVAIHGHTDDVGSDKDNLKLSQGRAKSVRSYLMLSKVDPARLTYKGFGESRPLVPNTGENGRAQNRRTEFVILSF